MSHTPQIEVNEPTNNCLNRDQHGARNDSPVPGSLSRVRGQLDSMSSVSTLRLPPPSASTVDVLPHDESAAGSTPPAPSPLAQHPGLSRFGALYPSRFHGPEGAARRQVALVVFKLVFGIAQAITVIVLLSIAGSMVTPYRPLGADGPGLTEWETCHSSLATWCILWVVKVLLSCTLVVWNFKRDRTAPRAGSSDIERGGATRLGHTGTFNSHSTPPVSAHTHSFPVLHSRLSLFSSIYTAIWFLGGHVLAYMNHRECMQTAPHIWWLLFALLCLLYALIAEVVVLAVIVFFMAPMVILFWNLILLCLGRHPIQNTELKPEIEKIPKEFVNRIPLVIYIPPPPDQVETEDTIAIPVPVYSYPPKVTPSKAPKRRFKFLRLRSSKSDTQADPEKQLAATGPRPPPQSWEEHFEQGEYPFVRLEGNRAACAICLCDFEEPNRVGGIPTVQVESTTSQLQQARAAIVDEVPTSTRLEDAGEGAQPLRLLECGHVFHATCIDPWLIDMSGRCPVCQRRVSVPEAQDKPRRWWRGRNRNEIAQG